MRAFSFTLSIAAASLLALHSAGAADAVPEFNITANCKAEVAGGSGIGETLESCINDEQQARAQVKQQWAQFSREDKVACIRETSIDGSPSYVELQTCLEIFSSARARPGEKQ